MSDVAQKRDLSDPRTVRDFATVVKSRTKLKLLTVLTVCDIRGVGPGVWNNWKAQLLRNLYHITHKALSSGLEDIGAIATVDEAQHSLKKKLVNWDPKIIEQDLGRHYKSYWQGLNSEIHFIMANLLKNISNTDDLVQNNYYTFDRYFGPKQL